MRTTRREIANHGLASMIIFKAGKTLVQSSKTA